MDIKYIRAMWGMEEPDLEANLRKIKDGGFDGVEMQIPTDQAQKDALRGHLERFDLDLVAQVLTVGPNPQAHINSFESRYREAVSFGPLLVNAHTGRDIFSLEENIEIFERALELERDHGVMVAHETHRGRPTFSTTSTMTLLDELPDLKLTADFSHWCCVHESLLEDQRDWVQRAIEHSHHTHARVGFEEGPQITDPRASEWEDTLQTHLGWWREIVNHHHRSGSPWITICPEFGPPPYMPIQPFTRQPVADLWNVNLYMMKVLKEQLPAGRRIP
jgi:sugar phosphate isomerase/epimerase